jgi:hypothetical protein
MINPSQSNINESTQKRENTRNKKEGPMSKKDERNHLRGRTTKGTSSSQTPSSSQIPLRWSRGSISNKEKGEDLLKGSLV